MPRTPSIRKSTISDLTRLSKNFYNSTLRSTGFASRAYANTNLRAVRTILSYIKSLHK